MSPVGWALDGLVYDRCPCRSRTRYRLSELISGEQSRGPCARSHLGGSGGGAPQREREGHRIKRVREPSQRAESLLLVPLPGEARTHTHTHIEHALTRVGLGAQALWPGAWCVGRTCGHTKPDTGRDNAPPPDDMDGTYLPVPSPVTGTYDSCPDLVVLLAQDIDRAIDEACCHAAMPNAM